MRLLSLKVYAAAAGMILARAAERPETRSPEFVAVDHERAVGILGSAPQAELFPGWIEAGYRGLVHTDREGWASFGWLASPASPPAVHLPRWAGERFWIFNCRTRDDRRGEGLYQHLLIELVRLASQVGGPEAIVFVDSISSNAPSVQAIEHIGFDPAGSILQLEVSRLGLRPSLPLGVPRGRPAPPR